MRNVARLAGIITKVYASEGSYAVLYNDGRTDDPIAEHLLLLPPGELHY